MAVKQKKRRWPDDEKRSICFQTTAAGVSVAFQPRMEEEKQCVLGKRPV